MNSLRGPLPPPPSPPQFSSSLRGAGQSENALFRERLGTRPMQYALPVYAVRQVSGKFVTRRRGADQFSDGDVVPDESRRL